MAERKGPWSKQEIFDALQQRGAAPGGSHPMNTIGNRLLEMAAGGQLRRAGRGSYELTPEDSD
jgi:hypothetical protein